MSRFLKVISLSFLFLSFDVHAQSVSQNAENMFTEGSKEKPEIVEGIKDTLSETDNSVTKTVEELENDLTEEDAVAEDNVEAAAPEATEAAAPAAEVSDNPMENIIIMSLKSGQVIIQLKPEAAPRHVARIKQLVKEGFYDGIVFHRVIDGFMAQTGDPTGTGRGGSGQKLEAEFSEEKHIRGTVAMARAADPNSADSQFFIMFDEAPHLDGNYTVFGQVVSGMEFVDQIKKGFGPNGMVSEPENIVTMKVAADIAAENLPAFLKEEFNKEDSAEPAKEEAKEAENAEPEAAAN